MEAEDGIRDFCLSRGVGDEKKRQVDRKTTIPGRGPRSRNIAMGVPGPEIIKS